VFRNVAKKSKGQDRRKCNILFFSDDNGRDRNQWNNWSHFDGNSTNRLHMGSEFATRVKWL